MIVLVTGTTGFIGGRLVSRLVISDMQVEALVREARFAEMTMRWLSAAVTTCLADLAEPAMLQGICDGVETVFHLAGYAYADDTSDEPVAANHQQVTAWGTRA